MKARKVQAGAKGNAGNAKSPKQKVHDAVVLAATTDFHILRKVWHVVGGLGLAVGYGSWLSWTEGTIGLGVLFSLFAIFELARQRSAALNNIGLKVMGPLLRSHEASGLSGSFYFFMGAFVVVLLFPKPIAVLSLAYLSCGDPVASAAGILCGRGPWSLKNGKSLCGALLGGLVCGLLTWYGLDLLYVTPTPYERLVVTAIGALVPGLTELLTPAHRPRPFPTDDNFLIPITSALALTAAAWLHALPAVPNTAYLLPA